MDNQKKQMQEIAVLYYEKNLTQSEIAKILKLSRQTVSKLLNEAIKENIVEIKIHDPEITCIDLENGLCRAYGLENAIVSGVSTDDEGLCRLMTVRRAADYLKSIIKEGNKKIAISWGRTISQLTSELEHMKTEGNTVFPLFGATDTEEAYYLSNELARSFADKIDAGVKYAWFPYRPDSVSDCGLFKKTSYYQKLTSLWGQIDLAIVGIGSRDVIKTFSKAFGYSEKGETAIGDVSTHFFDAEGNFVEVYENTLCASVENLKSAKETVAIACGRGKTEAIIGALRTNTINTLITDEYTARRLLS